MPSSSSPPSLAGALAPIALTMALLMVQIFVLSGPPHIPLILGTGIAALFGLVRGCRWGDIQEGIVSAAATSIPVVFIFLLVGMTIGTWILAGTVPLMITLGVKWISLSAFLPVCCLVCAVVSVFTGTSWGTVGTLGLALMTIGASLDIPPAITAGAVVSGAWFGDKISPLSDTTNYTAAVAGTDLYTHIRNLIPTTLPSLLLALLIYAVLGSAYVSESASTASAAGTGEVLNSLFRLNVFVLFPPVVIGVTIVRKVPPIPGIFLGVVAAALVALSVQGASFADVADAMMNGFVSDTGNAQIDALLTKGGLMSMMWVISLIIIALAFGGALEKTGCLETIVRELLGRLQGRAQLITGALLTTFGFNLASNAFVAYTIPGRLFADAFAAESLAPAALSRVMEDGATMSAPLIPWNSGGAFVSGALGVPALAYAPFAFANWLAPLFSLLWAWTGFFIPTLDDSQGAQPAPEHH